MSFAAPPKGLDDEEARFLEEQADLMAAKQNLTASQVEADKQSFNIHHNPFCCTKLFVFAL